MDYKHLISALAVFLSFIVGIIYARSMFKGETKPHAFSWGIWTLTTSIIVYAQYTEGAGVGTWLQIYYVFLCGFVAIFSLIRGDRSYSHTDWISLFFALGAIPLWQITQTPLWSVLLLCIIDTLGFVPTFRKSWHKPTEESILSFAIWGISAFLSIAAMEAYTASTISYPIVLGSLNSLLACMLILRRKHIK